MSINVAIDGPAGAGKSTIAKKLAKDLDYIYVDTGAMYRALAYFLIKKGMENSSEEQVSEIISQAQVSIQYENNQQQVYLNGENVTAYLRTEEVGNMASKTSAYKAVRAHLLALQQELAQSNNVIMDGRDIGTCVLPHADYKIYLTASVETRAKRRFDELVEKGETPDYDKIAKDIEERDYRDMHREIAPLKKAEDAHLVDSSNLSIEEVVQAIKDIMK
ncbi:MAG: (d)CMP kinase [Lachnospiraceae bacterium]|nr:(d)CMP kinase [Lachnospiraceae bacterium]